jgi:hypothetical protein
MDAVLSKPKVSVWVSVSKRPVGPDAEAEREDLLKNLVSLTFASWNRISAWLRRLDGLQRTA